MCEIHWPSQRRWIELRQTSRMELLVWVEIANYNTCLDRVLNIWSKPSIPLFLRPFPPEEWASFLPPLTIFFNPFYFQSLTSLLHPLLRLIKLALGSEIWIQRKFPRSCNCLFLKLESHPLPQERRFDASLKVQSCSLGSLECSPRICSWPLLSRLHSKGRPVSKYLRCCSKLSPGRYVLSVLLRHSLLSLRFECRGHLPAAPNLIKASTLESLL